MSSVIEFFNSLNQLIEAVPLWLWQVLGSMSMTIVLMQLVKMFEPLEWSPYFRRKFNLALSLILGAGVTYWIYDQPAKDFVVVAVTISNSFLYSGLAKLVRHKAETKNGVWTVLNSFLHPQTRKVKENGVVKEKDLETDQTIVFKHEDEAAAPRTAKRLLRLLAA